MQTTHANTTFTGGGLLGGKLRTIVFNFFLNQNLTFPKVLRYLCKNSIVKLHY